MRDTINFGALATIALMAAALLLGRLDVGQGAKFTRPGLISPSLSDYGAALSDGTVLGIARERLIALRDG